MRPPQAPGIVVANWCLAGAIAVILAAGYLLDGPDDIKTAQAVADEAEYAAALADGGAAKCAQYGRTPTWTASGDLVCRDEKSVIAQGRRP
jgi:hypothetical protein